MLKLRRFVMILAACTVAATTVAACSSQGSSSSGPSGNSSGSGGSLQTVTVGVSSINALHLWELIAEDQGTMKPYGINFKVTILNGTGPAVAALVSNAVQFAPVAPGGLFAAQDKDKDLKMVATEVTADPNSIFVSSNSITTLKDLKGKVLGVNTVGSSIDYFDMKLMLNQLGLTENTDYTFRSIGTPAARTAAVLTNQVGAIMAFPPQSEQLEAKGLRDLANAYDYPMGKDAVVNALVADSQWYSTHHTTAVDFMKGRAASINWLDNPANKTKAIADIASGLDTTTQGAQDVYDLMVVQLKAFSPAGTISTALLTKAADDAREAGLSDVPADNDLAWRVDNSLATAAEG